MDKSYVLITLEGVQLHIDKKQFFFSKEEVEYWRKEYDKINIMAINLSKLKKSEIEDSYKNFNYKFICTLKNCYKKYRSIKIDKIVEKL
jgi:hypothetical protein